MKQDGNMSGKKEKQKRMQVLTDRAHKTREGRLTEWDYLIKTDPDMFEAYQNVYEKGLLPGKELPTKYRELVCMAILAFRGSREGVISHGLRAHRLGATRQEVLDAAETTMIPGGAPTFRIYLAAVEAIEKEDKKARAVKKT
jgi:alkylhydroperoxidase/carboxymuconolactone decarboxylase family protein YurZ